MKLQTYTSTGKPGTLTVSDAIFAAPVNKALLSQAVRVYLSNGRQGTSKVKTRSEVNLTKKKMYKQKGTGGARHGAQSAPIFVGGGVAHGPKGIQNYSLRLLQKQKQKALISALSWQVESIQVMDELENSTGKTSELSKLLTKVSPDARKITIVIPTVQAELKKACRNIENTRIIAATELTALDVLQSDTILITTAAVKALEEKLATLASTVKRVVAKKAVKVPHQHPAVVKALARKAAAKTAAKK